MLDFVYAAIWTRKVEDNCLRECIVAELIRGHIKFGVEIVVVVGFLRDAGYAASDAI